MNKKGEVYNGKEIKESNHSGILSGSDDLQGGRRLLSGVFQFRDESGDPIFHSKDLANWEQIGNAMTPENGFHVEKNTLVGGVMAPTLRYNDGLFYIINTNFSDKGNYIITAEDPAGPWSEPHWLTDVPGIECVDFL